ncbi:MAG: glycerophosphodiester phosphodiesterase [Christensenellaceae bacterium]
MRKIVFILIAAVCGLGFALPVKAAPASAENDAASFASDGFYAQPSVILKISEKESAASLSEERLPASVFLSIDENLAVLGKDGETLETFRRFTKVKSKESDARGLPRYVGGFRRFCRLCFREKYNRSRDSFRKRRGAQQSKIGLSARAYYIALASSTDDCLREIGKANAVGAQVLIFSAEETNAEYIRFIQARFKCVWVDTDGSAEQIADAVGQGAYGIIAPDAAKVFEVYGKIGSAKEKNYILSRAPYIAAHRGDTTVHSENTVGAIEDAARIGATHVEIDIRLTADEQIVLLHDDDIRYALRDDAGNPAAGYVSKLTLAQLKSYTMSDGVSKIPTLDEVFEAVNRDGVGDMVLIIEFKGQEAKLVDLFRQKVAEYGMAGRITVISFYPAQLVRVAEQLPSVPASLLLYTDGANAATSQAYSNGSGIDMQFNGGAGLREYYGEGSTASAYADIFRTFADKGYSLWLWTYETDTMPEALRNGVTGITTNDAAITGSHVEKLFPQKTYEVKNLPADGERFR